MPRRIVRIIGIVFLIACGPGAPYAAGATTEAAPGSTETGAMEARSEKPQAGPAREANARPDGVLFHSDFHFRLGAVVNTGVPLTLWPLQSAAGAILGSFTDRGQGLPEQTLTEIEQTKIEMARQAIGAAEAAGTRMVMPREAAQKGVLSERELERIKFERLASRTPTPLSARPGTSPAGTPRKISEAGRPEGSSEKEQKP